MTILFNNNAGSTLAGAISNTATSVNLAAGTGVLFTQEGSPSVSDYVVCTFTDAATGLLTEIVHVTNVTGDVITMIRAQEGTTALSWQAGDIFAEFWTAGQCAAMVQTTNLPSTPATGQCLLSVVGGNLVLTPSGGQQLIIDGTAQAVPAAGVSLAPTSLTPGDAYYIYAFMNVGTMTLEASLTAHATDLVTAGNIGIEIKTSDPTRSLVGFWLVGTGPAWSTVANQGLNWFNRSKKSNTTGFSTGRNTTSASLVEVNNEIRNTFLVWAGQIVEWKLSGGCQVGLPESALGSVAAAFDGVAPENTAGAADNAFASSVTYGTISTMGDKTGLSEGAHYVTLVASVSTGMISFQTGTAGTNVYPIALAAAVAG